MLPDVCGLWIGPSLSKIERLCIRSFQDHGHKFILYTYGEMANVPPGTVVLDANTVLPEVESVPFVKRGDLAHFADWFRWELLRRQGGYWVDMDMVCLAPFDFSAEIVFGHQHDKTPNISVLRFPPNHPAVIELVDRSMNPNQFRHEDSTRRKIKKTVRRLMGNSRARVEWAEAGGPTGFRAVVNRHQLTIHGLPYTVFYPVHNTQFWSMFDATFARDETFFAETRAVHLWNEVGRRYFNWDKNATFHPDSLIERLKRKHDVG